MTDDLVGRLQKLLADAEQQRREALNHLPGDTKTMMLTNASHAERHVLAQVPLLFARIEALEAENRKLRRLARATEIRMRTACDHTKAGKDHVKVRIADWHVLMNIGLTEAPAALTPEPSHAD